MFDGNSAGVQVGNGTNLQLQDFTIEGWIRRTSASSVSSGPLGFIFSAGSGGYGLYLDQSGNPTLTKITVNNVAVTAPITDTNFHHLAVTKAGSNVVFYVDGAAYPAAPYNPGFTFSAGVTIGSWNLGDTFLGAVDDLAVYNRALTSNEVQSIYGAAGSGKCAVTFAPFIVGQPSNQTNTIGSNVTFKVTSGGTPPFAYQWSFNGVTIAGATNSSLTLTNAQFPQAGRYSVMVANAAGSTVSSNASLTLVFPPALVQVVGTNGAAGGTVSVPILLAANGNEGALGFSLNFDTTKLAFIGASLGAGATGAVLVPNTTLTNSGKVGLAIALPAGATFNRGTQQVVQVGFSIPPLTIATTTTVTFGDQPTPRQLWDAQVNALSSTFGSSATISIAASDFEGDVLPRPSGDRVVGLSDWLLMGRYVARLDYPTNGSEFQRADCAPRSTRGDGSIKVTDWVQSGRYAFGWDPLSVTGGPTNEIAGTGPLPSPVRVLTASAISLANGQSGTVSVTLSCQGNENASGFSLNFDPARVSFAGTSLGGDAAGAALYVNTNQASAGRLGFALALGTGSSFAAGTRELARVTFIGKGAGLGSFSPVFADVPVPREVSDPGANGLPTSFANGMITTNPPPSLNILQLGQSVVLSWPAWATNYLLQESGVGLSPAVWTNTGATPIITGNQSVVSFPLKPGSSFYRLAQP
jgi:hypothetical protein